MVSPRQPFKRAERVSDLLRQVLSETLMRKTPHLGLEGVTVTGVNISDDLQHARVYYRVLDPQLLSETAHKLSRAVPLLRKEVGRQLKMRYTPHLTFHFDESLEYGSHIERLLESIRKDGNDE